MAKPGHTPALAPNATKVPYGHCSVFLTRSMLRNELLHLPDHHSAPGHAAPSTPVTVKLSVIWRSVVYSGRLALRAAAGVERGSISLTSSSCFLPEGHCYSRPPCQVRRNIPLLDPPVAAGPHGFPVPTPESSFSNPYLIYLQVSYFSCSFLLPTPRERN